MSVSNPQSGDPIRPDPVEAILNELVNKTFGLHSLQAKEVQKAKKKLVALLRDSNRKAAIADLLLVSTRAAENETTIFMEIAKRVKELEAGLKGNNDEL